MRKRILSVVLSTAMVMAMLTGCGASQSKEKDSSKEESKTEMTTKTEMEDTKSEGESKDSTEIMGKEYNIVVMPKLVGIPFYTACEEGTKKAAKELGVNVIFNGPTVADAAEQVKMLEDYITQGVDAICVAPNDAAALDNVLKKAQDAGIKILDWDSEANKDLVDLSIHQIDDQEYAEHMMEGLAKLMGEKGEYAILTGGLSADNLNTWIKFGKAYQEEKYPEMKLVADPFPTDEKQDVALSTTKDIMKAYPEVTGLYCMSTPTPLGAAQAIKELGLQDKVSVVGTAIKEDCQQYIEDGSLDLGCLWSCPDLGYLTVACAKALLDGVDVKDGADIEGWGKVRMATDKNVILGSPEDYTK